MSCRSWLAVAIVGNALLFAACGDNEGDSAAQSATTSPPATAITTDSSTTSTSPSTPAPEPASISVEDLFDGEGPREALIEGFVVVDAASARLCSTLLESYPPQCGSAWTVIANPDGLDVEFDETQGIAWSPSPVRVAGFHDGNRLIVDGGPDVAPTAADEALIKAFTTFAATGAGFEDVGFADEVGVGLADRIVRNVPATELVDPAAWAIDDDGFRARTGAFSALDLATGEMTITVGAHPRCASPPVAAPTGLAEHRRVSIQPTNATSCLEWSTVDFFVDASGNVDAVTLDLFEP